jgi:hypothetical protein
MSADGQGQLAGCDGSYVAPTIVNTSREVLDVSTNSICSDRCSLPLVFATPCFIPPNLHIDPDIDRTVEQGGPLARLFAPSDTSFEHMFAASAGPLLELVVLPLPTGVDVRLQARDVSASSGWVAVSAGLGQSAD